MQNNTAARSKTADLTYIAVSTAIMAVCSWISIPSTVPFTLQTFGVFFGVGLLGGRRGTIAVAIYIALGIVGVPVFASFASGPAYLLGPTGGYIAGFIFMAATMWLMERLLGKRQWVLVLSMFIGLAVLYAFGTVWFVTVYNKTASIGVWAALSMCVFPYVLPDTLKLLLALALIKRLKPHIDRNSL